MHCRKLNDGAPQSPDAECFLPCGMVSLTNVQERREGRQDIQNNLNGTHFSQEFSLLSSLSSAERHCSQLVLNRVVRLLSSLLPHHHFKVCQRSQRTTERFIPACLRCSVVVVIVKNPSKKEKKSRSSSSLLVDKQNPDVPFMTPKHRYPENIP